MTTDEAEETTLDRDGSGPPDDPSEYFNDAIRMSENSGAGSESGMVQQANNDSLFVDPSPLEVGNSQAEQDQGQVESTNLEASHSAPTLPASENISIPSIIDTTHDPSHGPYERSKCQPAWYKRNVDPYQELLDHDYRMKIQIEKGQSSPDNSEPGPIPSIMDMHQDLANGLYDPHQNNYTVLNTRLSRAEAKDLRDQIRNIGLDAFAAPEWEPRPDRGGTVSGWQFRHSRGRFRESISTVFRGDREGINRYLMHDETNAPQRLRRISMIVQRDGGEVKVERIMTKRGRTLTHNVLEIFEDFEVASVFELDEVPPNGRSCLVEFVKFGEAERACRLVNRMEYNGTNLQSHQSASQRGSDTEETETEETDTEEANTEEADTEEANTEEADTEEADTEEADTEEADTEEADTEEADTEEADTEEADTEETDTEETNTEETDSVSYRGD